MITLRDIIEIKRLAPEDLDDMLMVEEETWEPDLRADRETIRERLYRFPEGNLGAYVNNNLAGFTFAQRISYPRKTWEGNSAKEPFDPDGKYLYIVNVGVSSRYRGMKVGTRMLDENKKLAKELGCDVLCLGARDTDGNIPFYTKNGFAIYETVNGFWPEDKASNGIGHLMEHRIKD